MPLNSSNEYYQYKIRSQCEDGTWSDFSPIETFYTNICGANNDSDNDGVCDGEDTCPGFDDNVDSDNDDSNWKYCLDVRLWEHKVNVKD